MLTPEFKITQTEAEVVVAVRLPYVKVSSCEFYIEEHTFKLYLKPYLLSLTFEECLQEAEEPAKAIYYQDKYILEVRLNKKQVGEHFQNLNLLSSLLNTKKSKKKKTLVEVIGQGPQVDESAQSHTINQFAYGFSLNYSGVFEGLQEEVSEIFSLNPQEVAKQDRLNFSRLVTESALDEEAYMFDQQDNQQQINRVICSQQPERALKQALAQLQGKQPEQYAQFKLQLKLPNKQLMVGPNQELIIMKQLVSIAVSFAYELCCMDGELSVESAKTINNTSAVLSCCVDYRELNLTDVLIDCARRCIAYSLYKHVQICHKAIQLVGKHLTQQYLQAILFQLRSLFNKSEPRELLNQIFIDDYLIYCSRVKIEAELKSAADTIKEFKLTEDLLNFSFSHQQQQPQQQQQQEQEQVHETKGQPHSKPNKLVEVISQSQQEQALDT